MPRKCSPRIASICSAKSQDVQEDQKTPKTPVRPKPTSVLRKSLRSPAVIKEEDGRTNNTPAKRPQPKSTAKSPVIPAQKSPKSAVKSTKHPNKKEHQTDSPAISTLNGIQVADLRECSVVLQSVEIPDTVYLDLKTKRRLSSIFKACRKIGKRRDVIEADSSLEVKSPITKASKPSKPSSESSESPLVNSKTRVTVGKRKRDSDETEPAIKDKVKSSKRISQVATNASKSRSPVKRTAQPPSRIPRPGPRSAAKRRKLSSDEKQVDLGGNKTVPREESDRTGSQGREEVDSDSMCWDRSSGSPVEQRGDTASDSTQEPSKSNGSATSCPERMALVPVGDYFKNPESIPPGYVLVPQVSRCVHCSCQCKVDDDKVDKNQPLITTFLRRTPSQPIPDIESNASPQPTENDSAPVSEEPSSPTPEVQTQDDAAIDISSHEPMDESVETGEQAEAPPVTDCAEPESATPEDEEVTPEICAENTDATGEEGADTSEHSPVGTEEPSVLPECSSGSEVVSGSSQEEKIFAEESPTMAEGSCSESEKDRSSLSEIKLVLEDTSDGIPEDDVGVADRESAAKSCSVEPADDSTKQEADARPEDSDEVAEVEDSTGSPEADVNLSQESNAPLAEEAKPASGKSPDPEEPTVDEVAEPEEPAVEEATDPKEVKEADAEGNSRAEEAIEKDSVAEEDSEEGLTEPREDPESSQVKEEESSNSPIVTEESSGEEFEKDSESAVKPTCELVGEEHSDPSPADDDDEVPEGPVPLVESPVSVLGEVQEDEDASDNIHAASAGSEVLCFLESDTKDSDMDLVMDTGMTPEVSPEAVGTPVSDNEGASNDKIDRCEAVVGVTNIV